MFLSQTFVHLADVCDRHELWYRLEIEADDVLGQYPSPSDVVDALSMPSPLSVAERNAVVFALVRAHHTRPHVVWLEILVQAFKPMLLRLRRCVRGALGPDVDQQILMHFIDAVRAAGEKGSPDRVAMRLRQDTIFAVLNVLRKDLSSGKPPRGEAPGVAAPGVSDHFVIGPFPLPDDALSKAVIQATSRGELRDVVREFHPNASPEELERTYRRLQRRRHRLFRALRAKVENPKPRPRHSSQGRGR